MSVDAPAQTPPPVRAAGPVRPGKLTEGPIGRTLLMFSLPILAGNMLQSLNGSVNAIWVGRLLGETALAATSNANLIMFLIVPATGSREGQESQTSLIRSRLVPGGRYLTVPSADGDPTHRVIFETNGTRVTRYRAGVRPAVEYVEGCA